ncbi:MAG: hypothetical protein M3Q44_03940 [bacterium]|nr:hypothetical protein [bacterium]
MDAANNPNGYNWRIPEIPSEEWRNDHPEWRPETPSFPVIILNYNPSLTVDATAWTEGGNKNDSIVVWNKTGLQCYAPQIPTTTVEVSTTPQIAASPSPTIVPTPVIPSKLPPTGAGNSGISPFQIALIGLLMLVLGAVALVWLGFNRKR